MRGCNIKFLSYVQSLFIFFFLEKGCTVSNLMLNYTPLVLSIAGYAYAVVAQLNVPSELRVTVAVLRFPETENVASAL